MIFQFVFLDFGATNLLSVLKYSALNLRNAIQKDGGDHQIRLRYVRSLGRNPTYDIASLKTAGIFDRVDLTNFGQEPHQITMTTGWYQKCHLAYLEQAVATDEPMCYLHHNINFHHVPEIDTSQFYFWAHDNKWYDISWGFLTKNDAELFVNFCRAEGLLSGEDIMSYSMLNANFLHIPKHHVQEVKDKYEPMVQWILDYYSDYFSKLYCACSAAGQLCLSLIVRDMLGTSDGIHLADIDFPFPQCSRFGFEAEQDISGSLRLFFE